MFEHFRQDLRSAIRNLRRYPIAAIVAVLSLAAGIGATTVTLTVRNVLFRKPPALYQDPGQLSRVQVGTLDRPIYPIGNPVPAPLYIRWSDALGPAIGGAAPTRERDVRLDGRVEPIGVRPVTANMFDLLGVQPALGRPLSSDRARAEGRPAILSYRVWLEYFDARSDAIGRTFWIDNQPHVAIGVMPERFWLSSMGSPIWTELDPRMLGSDDAVEAIVRRPAGVTAAMLEAQLRGPLADYARTLPENRRQLVLKASGVEGTPIAHQMSIALPYLLATSVLLTLLIACANVAILMIAQWTARQHEIAIRASIGASRGRIVRSLLTESVVVASLGGALGMCVVLALRGWIVSRGGQGFYDLTIDSSVLVQTMAIALLTGVAAGLAPALYETRTLHGNPLRLIASSDRVRQRLRHSLVVFEITVTVALLVVTSSMVDGYLRTLDAESGYSSHSLITARVENSGGVAVARLLDVFRAVPGVASAAASTSVPFSGRGTMEHVAVDGAGNGAVTAERAAVTPDFFSTLGVSIRAGRAFSITDTAGTQAAILTDSLASRLLPGRTAVGARVWIGQTPYDIVGTVADYSSNVLRPLGSEPRIFVPMRADARDARRMSFAIRAHGDPAALVQQIRREARDATPGNIASAETMDQIVTIVGQEILVGTAPLFPIIAIGMLLTMTGIYGVLAFAIARRSKELAVRIAVGASRRHVMTLVTLHSVRLLAIGVTLGIGLTFVLARVLRANGGAGSVYDPPLRAFLVPIAALVTIGLIATWLPARRAAKIDPIVLLRLE
ncbi:MAG TPA: ABC transporter permease [Vicinamibacterales bacterium]|jgi:predicted permease